VVGQRSKVDLQRVASDVAVISPLERP
jgi:hypothetical protein